MSSLDSVTSTYERHRQALAKLSQVNKRAVFDVLATTNITLVSVEFDGEGDSGQITGLLAFRNDESIELPATNVTIQRVSYGDTEPVTAASPLREAIETLCHDLLGESHGGWEINDGAYGEFRFDVATRTIELEFNARFTDVSTSSHTF
jgi:hypothetical protein